jgi:hypothetical protein
VRDQFLEFVYRRWRDAITRKNPDNGQLYRAPDFQHGISLTESHRDDYVAKFGLADELALSPSKEGRPGGQRTPMQILSDISAAGQSNERDVALWREYATEMHGARQLTWSKGLRSRFSIEEATDDEFAGEPESRSDTEIAVPIAPFDWDSLVANDVSLQLRILEAAAGASDEREMLDVLTRLIDRARWVRARARVAWSGAPRWKVGNGATCPVKAR